MPPLTSAATATTSHTGHHGWTEIRKPDNLPLPNLALSRKLFYSILLVTGSGVFVATWAAVMLAVYGPSGDFGERLGVALGMLALNDSMTYGRLLLAHGSGMLLMLGLTYRLLLRTSLRRRPRNLLFTAAAFLAVMDIGAWLYAPSCTATNLYVGLTGLASGIPLLVLAFIPFREIWFYRRWRCDHDRPQRVVIVGGGFAGLYTALGLNRKLGYHTKLEIVVLDRNNYFLFPPLLPSTAAGTIETRQVTYPFRRIFETTNIVFRRVEVTDIDTETQCVHGWVEAREGSVGGEPRKATVAYAYDHLVIAPGSTTQTFNTPGVERHAFFMRELQDAVSVRNHVIDCFERAAVLDDSARQQELLRFVVIGAGPTGVETATEIHDLIHQVLLKRYPEISPDTPEVCVVQSGERVLPGWHEGVVRNVERQIEKLGVKVLLGARVSEVGSHFVSLADGVLLPCRTAIWCAGVKAHPLLARTGLPLHPSGRVVVDETLRPAGFENVYVLGDAACLLDPVTGQPLPPLGQVAFQQGSHLAKNLVHVLGGGSPSAFKYFNFGSLVSVGEHYAAVRLMGVKLTGFLGWFAWRFLYLVKIVGLSNKIRIILDWTLDLVVERSFAQIGGTGKTR